MVVETARDLAAMEAGGRYRGLYFVLGGRLSPLDGGAAIDVGPLTRRASDPEVEEVCLATNPDLEGDGASLILARALVSCGVRVTRLARGLPAGGQIEYQNAAVLADAFEGRRAVED
jgi:recombination protein RecR